jgi:hypothetical protein
MDQLVAYWRTQRRFRVAMLADVVLCILSTATMIYRTILQ